MSPFALIFIGQFMGPLGPVQYQACRISEKEPTYFAHLHLLAMESDHIIASYTYFSRKFSDLSHQRNGHLVPKHTVMFCDVISHYLKSTYDQVLFQF